MISRSAVQQRSGVFLDPFDPDPACILIEDIALGLSREGRFGHQLSRPWSVAHHCLLVSAMCSEPNKLAALLHDAEEWIFHDMGRPIKHDPRMTGYRDAASALRRHILVKFGLPAELPDEVIHFDDVLVAAEAEELHHGTRDWPVKYEGPTRPEIDWARDRIKEMIDLDARQLFLKQFTILTGGDVHA